jgi:hypothetical protein
VVLGKEKNGFQDLERLRVIVEECVREDVERNNGQVGYMRVRRRIA